MKILIITSSIVPNGGTERVISNLTRIFKNIEGLKVKLISISSTAKDIPAFTFHSTVIHLAQRKLESSIFGKLMWYAKVVPLLKKKIREESPDIVLSMGHNISIMMPFVNRKRVYTFACEHINFHTIPRLYRTIIKVVYPKLYGVIVLSKLAREKLREIHPNIYIIPNSLSFPNTKAANLYKHSIIMVGRISSEKGYDRMPAIASILKRELPDWHINIFGDGPDRKKIEKMCEERDVSDYVTFWGSVSDIREKYLDSSILMLTSYTEALPMAIIEANACGLPVVAYENEGVNSLIESGYNGYKIESDNLNEFAEKVCKIANDPTLRQQMSENSIKASSEYSESSVAEKWRQLFSSISK